MQHSQEEVKRVLDHGMVTKSIIENEVAMKKCFTYSQMAQDKEVKSFFQSQANALEGVVEFFKQKHAELM